MANPTPGTKFASVNLNKSYFQHSNSYGSNRNRANGGGSVVVLSRPRSSHKAAGTKLSVPPPLNLPSLRKEHERFDSLGSGAGPAGAAGSGGGSRPASSGMGWTKPATIALPEKEHSAELAMDGFDHVLGSDSDGFGRGSTVYMPPSAGSVMVGPATPALVRSRPVVEKAAVLRGEDFPSLKAATLSSSAGTAQKLKEDLNQKQKQLVSDSFSSEQKDASSRLSWIVDVDNGLSGNGYERRSSVGGSRASEQQGRKQEEYFPGPLPLVPLKPRSDWADDERDTSHGFADRSRDHGFSRNETYWDRDFDMPRVGVLPQKPGHNFDKRGQRDNETRKVSFGEVSKLDPYARTASREEREGTSWRNSSFQKDGFGVEDTGNERSGFGAQPSSMNKEVGKDSKYVPSHFRDNAVHDPGKRDMGYGRGGKHPWNNTTETYGNRGSERNAWDRYAGSEKHSRNRVDSVQSSVSRSSFSLGGKGLPVNDPLLNFGREKRPLSKSEKSFLADPFTKDFGACGFDDGDILSAGLAGVVKKKKDVLKQTDFHDPVRESFEAELERVQRLQEQERQRIAEEQERASELARREEEERLRQAREHEERQRRLEEEAREAAWRAEQERIESLRKAEELRLAKEEEKRRIDLEEERRKQAAKQKLLELEQKIARRQAEASWATNVGDWDDSERMVERIITSASSDSSSVNRPHFSRDISSTYVDKGKPVNSWRNAFEKGSSSAPYLQEQDNGNNSFSPRRDSSIVGKPFMRKDYYGGAGLLSSRNSNRGGISDSHLDEYAHLQGHRWNQSGDGNHFSRNTEIDSDFHENLVERFSDDWSRSRSRVNPFPPYPDRSYPNSESDGPYNQVRSRYSVRQPRVLPPPTLASVHETYRSTNEYPGSSVFLEDEIQYDNRTCGPPEAVAALRESTENKDHEVEATHRCDSQSSLSVSNPPGSPTHLSHDDLDGSGDSPEEGKNGTLSTPENESVAVTTKTHAVSSSCAVSTADDDDEWTTENHEQFQEQEEYDEDEDYQEDEVHEGDDNMDLNQEFEEMHIEEKGLPHLMDNLVLGFDEGVQVGMPTEEFERTSKDEEHVSYDNPCNDGKALQPVDDSSQVNLNNSSSVFEDSDEPTQGLLIQPINAHPSMSLGNVEASNSGLSTHHCVPTSGAIAPHSSVGPNVMSNVAAPSQSEQPIKLQFGLFSGPSLIPSPVPAIQIGSIQMPLPLHSPVGAAFSHMHPSQSPLFQFGQLSYTAPTSQGIMPLGPHAMPYVQPNIAAEYSFNHNLGGQMSVGPGTSDQFVKNETRPYSLDNQPGISRHLSQGSLPSEDAEKMNGLKQGQIGVLCFSNKSTSTATATGFQVDNQGRQNLVGNTSSIANESKGQPVSRGASLHSVSKEKEFLKLKAQYPVPGGRGKRYVFAVKTPGSRPSDPVAINHSDSRGIFRRPRRNIQHTEFRVRETAEKRQSSSLAMSDQFGSDNKSNINGRGTVLPGKTGPRKTLANKSGKHTIESASENSRQVDSGSISNKVDGKESTKIQSISHFGQNNPKRTLCSEDDADAPLQSGIVRVYEQPGIEAPSDEDDFIEVRSKRQMLNDRRQQREREIKAKSRSAKIPRKSRSISQNAVVLTNYSKGSTSTGEMAKATRSHLVASEGHGIEKIDVSSGFDSSSSSQPLAPIGTPSLKIGDHSDLKSQTSRSLKMSLPAVLGGGSGPGPDVIFESNNKVVDNEQTSFGSWGNTRICHSQQVMALTQTQLDEAMKPQQFHSRASVGDLKGAANDPRLPTSSILTKEKTFSSVPSPINSLLVGEKIQFGAVTSPTVLPSSSHSVSHGIGPPHSSRSDMQISRTVDLSDNDSSIFFDKEKHSNESHGHLEDFEAEAQAEAAASAVAAAAISCDEVVGNGLGTCSIPVSDSKSFVAADIDGIASAIGKQSVTESRSEELSVSLPADLSVETPPISFWPPLQNQQNSSSQMISHFPAGPPHFPFYEMNPMMSGPAVFAFGPHDESASAAQTQPQKSASSVSGPIGSWHQCHPVMDSFYSPPTGFTGPFIPPPGGIPAVQGPHHMVVYNHFAPVGQFGQVGLSFMGTTYIPTGKQPDWKHNPTSSAAEACEGDASVNMASPQRNPANVPSPIQHLAPGSPLLPMPTPMTMFDVSPFQSPEMTAQTRWPHVPNSTVPSISLSMPSLQQGVHTSRYSHVPSVDQPLNLNRFTSPQISTSDGDRNLSTASDVKVNQLPDELRLVDHSNSTAAKVSTQSVDNKIPSDAAKADLQIGSGSNSNNQNASSAIKSQPSQQCSISTQQYDHSSGYTNQRGGNVSHRHSSSGGEWSHRRTGFQGRNQSLGADKSKVKQIYVAKQTMGGGASTMS
ncbi:hypothetical protein RIF29_19765 [Crotalaria pallida]|uniref:Uncharacterized protein n=1 Tax=Crotalaria pallida TaxID=3830 RepID=A0AAN9IBQ5_CROPI